MCLLLLVSSWRLRLVHARRLRCPQVEGRARSWQEVLRPLRRPGLNERQMHAAPRPVANGGPEVERRVKLEVERRTRWREIDGGKKCRTLRAGRQVWSRVEVNGEQRRLRVRSRRVEVQRTEELIDVLVIAHIRISNAIQVSAARKWRRRTELSNSGVADRWRPSPIAPTPLRCAAERPG